MNLRDLTGEADTSIRGRTRGPNEVRVACLHQTGTGELSDAALLRVDAHFVVLDSGVVVQLHPCASRLTRGSRWWNPRAITVEMRANLPGRYHRGSPRWWRPPPSRMSAAEWDRRCPPEAWDPEARRAQVQAARELLATLRGAYPALQVGAHRQVEAGKGGCCGPDLWREVGEWAVRFGGFELAPTHPRGRDLPADWRRAPNIPDAPGGTEPGPSAAGYHPTNRPYLGPPSLPLDALGAP